MRVFGKNETTGEPARRRNNGSKTRKKMRGSCSRDKRDWKRREERSSSGSTSRKRKSTHFSVLPVQMKKSLQAWVEDLLKIAAQDRKKEARERQSMGQEDSNPQRRRAWENIWDPRVLAPFLAAGN